ncbi:TPR-like protein, partial [Dendrothele bispora CBS 962.96]
PGSQLEQATPAVPRIFFGRDLLIKEGADYVTNNAQAFLAILGPGGIGKTALAQKIIDIEAVKEKFEKRCYFIPCDILPNVASLIQAMLQCLKIPAEEGKSQGEMLNDYLQLNARHTLLVLDNFETLWYSKGGRASVQTFLEKLFNFKHLCILVTMRGPDGPGNVEWYKLGTGSGIPPLSADAARNMFFAIAGNKYDLSEKTKAVDKLLKELDYVPLAIRLIAQRAKTSPLKSLLRMWKEGKTSILREGKEDFSRLTSVEYSIQLSVNLLDEDACNLLSVISFLPNGIPMWVDNLGNMLPNLENLDISVAELLECSLISSNGGNIYILAPTREYIQRKYPSKADETMVLLETFYIEWMRGVVANKSNMNKELQLHILNITKILNVQIGKMLKEEHIEVVEFLGQAPKFYAAVVEVIDNILVNIQDMNINQKNNLQFIKVDVLIWNAKWIEAEDEVRSIEEKNGLNHKNITARCFQKLGNIYEMQNKYNEATDMLSKAKTQFEEIGDWLEATQCLQRLGEIHRMQARYNEATEMVSKAKTQFEQIGDQLGAAQCLQSLGNIYRMQDRNSEATELLSKAKTQFEQIGDQLGAAQCLQRLGDIYRMQARYSEAIETLSKAKGQFEEIGSQLGAAQCLNGLGDIHYMQDRYSEATEMVSKAKTQFEQIGDQLRAAQCLQSLGDIHRMQDRYSEATEMLSKAKTQFEQIGEQLGAAQCLQSLADIHSMQDRDSEAIEMLSKAKTQFEEIEIGSQLGAAQCLQSLGNIYLVQDRYSEATELLSKAKTQFEQIGDQLGAAQCLQRLGDIHRMQDRYSKATEML